MDENIHLSGDKVLQCNIKTKSQYLLFLVYFPPPISGPNSKYIPLLYYLIPLLLVEADVPEDGLLVRLPQLLQDQERRGRLHPLQLSGRVKPRVTDCSGVVGVVVGSVFRKSLNPDPYLEKGCIRIRI